jgi:hypothetical protein
LITAHRAAVISSPDLGVFAVAAAGVLCGFCRVADALSAQCLRRTSRADRLVAAVFRTKWLLSERCSATCLRRRRPGQVRRSQGGLEITAVLRGSRPELIRAWTAPELAILYACESAEVRPARWRRGVCRAFSGSPEPAAVRRVRAGQRRAGPSPCAPGRGLAAADLRRGQGPRCWHRPRRDPPPCCWLPAELYLHVLGMLRACVDSSWQSPPAVGGAGAGLLTVLRCRRTWV